MQELINQKDVVTSIDNSKVVTLVSRKTIVDVCKFKNYLKKKGLSNLTIDSYLFSLNKYVKLCGDSITCNKLNKYKNYLVSNFKPQTINARIAGINCYLDTIKRSQWKLKIVKLQQKQYIENVISNADLEYLKIELRKKKDLTKYFIVRLLASTGMRVSELVKLKAEHVKEGMIDIYGKGCKYRRVFIPKELRNELLMWFKKRKKNSGYVFNTSGCKKYINVSKVRKLLVEISNEYNIDRKVMHAHGFRHRFAKNFIEKYKDIALLADLLGHSSIETTRIYLRMTSTEQRDIINEVVTW